MNDDKVELVCMGCGYTWDWYQDYIPCCLRCGSGDVLDPVVDNEQQQSY